MRAILLRSHVLALGLIMPFHMMAEQTSATLTNQDFKRITIRSGPKTDCLVPITTPGDRLGSNVSIPGESIQNRYDPTGWVLLQTVPGVVKAVSFTSPTVGYMAAELGVILEPARIIELKRQP